MLKLLRLIILHPALLFAAGNTALAFGHAENVAITLNILLVTSILIARSFEIIKHAQFGIPFGILAVVNFFTAGSVIYTNMQSPESFQFLDYLAAFSYVAWGVGHLLAGRHERKASTAKRVAENPQVFYGMGDMSAVNASGSVNPYSFPFMIVGFIKSIFIGRQIKSKNKSIRFINNEFTAARLYGAGFIIGAITSLGVPYFVIAQLLWGLGYFQFKKDT